jgi:predicted dehydrogenase
MVEVDASASKIRVALIGCGRVARRHVARMRQDPRVEIAVLVDPDRQQAESLARELHLESRIETDETKALTSQECDVALLASPTTLHARQATLGLTHGLDLLIEKPVASTAMEIDAIERAANRAGRMVGVAYQRRFEALYRTARREIQSRSDRYGTIHTVHIFVCEHWAQTIAGTWRDDPAISGGYFADGGSHQVDAAFFIMGEKPIKLRATTDRRDRKVVIQTRVEAVLSGGIRLFAHFVGDAHQWREDIIFHGTKGDLVLKNGQEIEQWHADAMGRLLDGEEGTSPSRAFVDSVMARRIGQHLPFDSPLAAGKVMMNWTDAVLRSAEQDQWVEMANW